MNTIELDRIELEDIRDALKVRRREMSELYETLKDNAQANPETVQLFRENMQRLSSIIEKANTVIYSGDAVTITYKTA
jgi:hypothetical protein